MYFYFTKNGYFGYNDNKNNFIACGNDVVVCQKNENIETKETTFVVEIDNNVSPKRFLTSFSSLQTDLEKFGYGITPSVRNHLVTYIQQQLDVMNADCVFSSIGWLKGKSGLLFAGDCLKGVPTASQYRGSFDIKPSGDAQDFISGFKSTVLPNNNLVLAAMIGLTACVNGFLKVNGVNIDTSIYNICGRSTTGKTTAAKLAVSMGGSITAKKDRLSLFGNCSATANAVEERLNANFGYPVAFDELGRLKKDIDVSQLIYDIAEGTNKDRLDANSKLKKPKKWATSVIFTGEYSILNKVDKTDGIGIRVITFEGVQWTQNEDEAHKVESFFTAFGGIGIDLLAEEILRHKASTIVKGFWLIVRAVKAQLEISEEYRERVGKSIAVLLLTALLAQRAFKIRVQLRQIKKMVLAAVSDSQARPIWEVAYDDLMQYVQSNIDNFNIKNVSIAGFPAYQEACKQVYGYVETVGECGKGTVNYIVMIKYILDKWFVSNQIMDRTGVLKEWAKNGLLYMKDQTHYYQKYSISRTKNKVSCYKIICLYNAPEIGMHVQQAMANEAPPATDYYVEAQNLCSTGSDTEAQNPRSAGSDTEGQELRSPRSDEEVDEAFEYFDRVSRKVVAQKEEEKKAREQIERELEEKIGKGSEKFRDIVLANDKGKKHT